MYVTRICSLDAANGTQPQVTTGHNRVYKRTSNRASARIEPVYFNSYNPYFREMSACASPGSGTGSRPYPSMSMSAWLPPGTPAGCCLVCLSAPPCRRQTAPSSSPTHPGRLPNLRLKCPMAPDGLVLRRVLAAGCAPLC